MDAADIWQENKKFIVTVGSGLLVFFIAKLVIDGMFLGDIAVAERSNGKTISELQREMYSTADRDAAEDENRLLTERYERIADAVAFVPRPEFDLDGSEESPQSAYSAASERMIERVGKFASRRRAFLPDGLDLEPVRTRNVDEIERHLHALDLLERALTLALDSGVRQVRGVTIKLDPAFLRRRDLGPIEKTLVEIDVGADPLAVTRWITACQTPGESGGDIEGMRTQALPIESLQIQSQKSKDGEVRATVKFLVVRIHDIDPEAELDA